MQLKPGESIDEYRILEVIGSGGFSVVYRAEDTNLMRPVAIKQLSPEIFSEEATREWFVREARLSASLNHPNIVAIYALREQGDALFLVMEYLPGGDLHELIEEQGPLSRSIFLKVAANMCHALETLHVRNVIHRDIKPENILIGPEDQFKLADFGLAHIRQAHQDALSDASGPQPGTLLYMSPEQALGQEITVRSDIYSLAVVLYEAMSGHYYLDFDEDSDDDDELTQAIVEADPRPIARHHESLPREVIEPLLRALSKKPGDRPATARAFLGEIKSAISRSKRSTLSQKRHELDVQPPETPLELLRQLYAVRTLRDAQNKPDQAQEQLQLIWEMSPGVPEVAAEWGETLVALGDIHDGRQWLERAIRIKPDLPFAQLALADIYRDVDESNDEADDAVIEAIHADPDLVYAVLYEDIDAALDGDEGDFDAYVALFERAAEEQPRADIFHNLGQVLALAERREDDSIAAFEKAIALDPDYAPAYVGLGSLLSELEQYQDAIELLEQATHHTFPDVPAEDWHKANTIYLLPHAYLALAVAYAESGQFENSAIAACMVLEMAPSELETEGPVLLETYLEAAETWIKAGQHLRAYKFLNQIIPLAAHWGQYKVFMLLGITQSKIGAEYRRKRQWEDAVGWLKAGLSNLNRTGNNDGKAKRLAAEAHHELEKAERRQEH
jgi:serine/threonine protein kinase/Tfp pilus assembly protein PilF